MRCRVEARFSREEQVTATRAAVDAARAPVSSHAGDRGSLQTRQLLQQRSGRHASMAMRPAGGRTCRRRHALRAIAGASQLSAVTGAYVQSVWARGTGHGARGKRQGARARTREGKRAHKSEGTRDTSEGRVNGTMFCCSKVGSHKSFSRETVGLNPPSRCPRCCTRVPRVRAHD